MKPKLLLITLTAAAIQAATAAELPGNTLFALDLYRQLATENAQTNLFFSPHSISTVMALTYVGARGQTATEMATTLHLKGEQSEVPAAFAALERRLAEVGRRGYVTLRTANSLWCQQEHPFLDEFLEIGRKSFNAELAGVDFAGDAEAARVKINRWVAGKTANKIPEIIQRGVLDDQTRLVLCNAVYFKGNWAKQFDPRGTHPVEFLVSPGETVQVPLMSQTLTARYAAKDGISMVKLPYVGGDLSMIVLLPEAKDGLQTLESKLNKENVTRWLGDLDKVPASSMIVELPKFKLNSQFDLKRTLSAMGMSMAFDQTADFSGMDGTHLLSISAVTHQAVVEVNEQGTVAAAATANSMSWGAPMQSLRFRADHPFIFLIRERQSGAILFLGRVVNPLK